MPIEEVRDDTRLELLSEPQGRVVIQGPGNTLRIGRDVVLNATLWLQGSGSVVEIGDNCHLDGMIHIVRGEGGLIRIGAGTTFNAVGVSMHEAGEIHIGRDCMFSTDIHMDVSDMHPIYDRATGQRINPARSIHIEDHVWVGRRVVIGKGVRIGEGAVIGGGSMVTGGIPAHSLAVGSPARVVRDNIVWRREFGEVVAPMEVPPVAPSRAGWVDRLKRLGQKAR
jgi:acetyltransferase-like isoleucine patch superfamily enzyme